MRALAIFLASCLLLAAGCGQKGDEVKTSSTSANEGWTKVTNDKAGISLKVPNGWKAIDLSSGELSTMLDEVAKTDPNIKAMGPTVKQLAATGLYKMFVFHVDPIEDGVAFVDNINIIAQAIPGGADFDAIVDGSMQGMAMAGGTTVDALKKETARVADRDCRIVSGNWEVKSATGTIPFALDAYHFLAKDQMIVVTCSSTQARMPGLKTRFREIVETLEIK